MEVIGDDRGSVDKWDVQIDVPAVERVVHQACRVHFPDHLDDGS